MLSKIKKFLRTWNWRLMLICVGTFVVAGAQGAVIQHHLGWAGFIAGLPLYWLTGYLSAQLVPWSQRHV